MIKYSEKLGDIFGQVYETKRPKMADIFALVASGCASATRVRKGDYGFDDLNNVYEGHMEFFIIIHNDDVYVVGMGFNYAEIIDVKQ